MLKEKWSKGKEAGCVVSDTPNRHRLSDDHVDYYGGYLVAESIPKQEYVNLIAAAPDLLKACLAVRASGGLEGANLSNAIGMCRAAIRKARGESEAQDG